MRHSSEYYRERAAKTRANRAMVGDDTMREVLDSIAEIYDHIAAHTLYRETLDARIGLLVDQFPPHGRNP